MAYQDKSYPEYILYPPRKNASILGVLIIFSGFLDRTHTANPLRSWQEYTFPKFLAHFMKGLIKSFLELLTLKAGS